MRKAVQICGIHDLAEAELVLRCGVDYLGFPLRLRDGREDLTESDARDIVRAIGQRAHPVVITYLDEAQAIAELTDFVGARWVQLHGPIEVRELGRLKETAPDLRIIKSLIIRGEEPKALLEELTRLSPLVDAFITDTYDPATGRSGATGKVHDWSVSRALVRLAKEMARGTAR